MEGKKKEKVSLHYSALDIQGTLTVIVPESPHRIRSASKGVHLAANFPSL
jgi:hypothetical protein